MDQHDLLHQQRQHPTLRHEVPSGTGASRFTFNSIFAEGRPRAEDTDIEMMGSTDTKCNMDFVHTPRRRNNTTCTGAAAVVRAGPADRVGPIISGTDTPIKTMTAGRGRAYTMPGAGGAGTVSSSSHVYNSHNERGRGGGGQRRRRQGKESHPLSPPPHHNVTTNKYSPASRSSDRDSAQAAADDAAVVMPCLESVMTFPAPSPKSSFYGQHHHQRRGLRSLDGDLNSRTAAMALQQEILRVVQDDGGPSAAAAASGRSSNRPRYHLPSNSSNYNITRRFLGGSGGGSTVGRSILSLYPLALFLASCLVVALVGSPPSGSTASDDLFLFQFHGLRMYHHDAENSPRSSRPPPPPPPAVTYPHQNQEVEFLPGMGMRFVPDVEEQQDGQQDGEGNGNGQEEDEEARVLLPTLGVDFENQGDRATATSTTPTITTTGKKKRRPRLAHARASGALLAASSSTTTGRMEGQGVPVGEATNVHVDGKEKARRRRRRRRLPTFVLSPEETDGSRLDELYSTRFGKSPTRAAAEGVRWSKIFLAVSFAALIVQVIWAYIFRRP